MRREARKLLIVIDGSKTSWCFEWVDKSHLPVKYFSQKKAWMSGKILGNVLSSANQKLFRKIRSVVLLMDNARCHPEDLKATSKIVFFPIQPPNRNPQTSVIFKTHYRRHYVLATINQCDTASEVIKSVCSHWVAYMIVLSLPKPHLSQSPPVHLS